MITKSSKYSGGDTVLGSTKKGNQPSQEKSGRLHGRDLDQNMKHILEVLLLIFCTLSTQYFEHIKPLSVSGNSFLPP